MQRSLIALFLSFLLASSIASAHSSTRMVNDDMGIDTQTFNDNAANNVGASAPADDLSNPDAIPTKGDSNDYSDMNTINPDQTTKTNTPNNDGIDADTATGDDDY